MKSLLTTYETVYKVEGMTCQACADTIEAGIKTNLGVLLAHVSLEKKELRIQSDTIFEINHINSVVTNLGDYRIRDKEKASKFYQQLILEYEGSIYVSEARDRFRILRGDKIDNEL